MSLLSQNTKMKKSSTRGVSVFNFTLPAFQSRTGLKTCPNAGKCASGCYARMGTYQFGNVKNKHEANLTASQSENFVADMIAEIILNLKRPSIKNLKLRIHDAGDFYSLEYFQKWLDIMSAFKNDSRVTFYAYSKQVKMIQDFGDLPSSFRVIFSYGGKQDELIDIEKNYHSKVFDSLESLLESGYVDGTLDDMIAAIGTSTKIGLVYHGAKSYTNTLWNKVAA